MTLLIVETLCCHITLLMLRRCVVMSLFVEMVCCDIIDVEMLCCDITDFYTKVLQQLLPQ